MLLAILALTIPGATATQDDCPNIVGTSTEDRHGCLDSDGDGWSDPEENWTVADGADAFPDIGSQWSDLDRDGYGDNGDFDAELIDHFPEDETLHKAVVSVGCNPPDHTIETGKSSHFTCTIQNEGVHRLRVFIDWNVSKGIGISSVPQEVILESRGISDDSTEIRLSFAATSAGLSGGDLILNESSDPTPIYSINLGVLVQDINPSTSSGDPKPSLDPFMRKMTDLSGWMSAKSGRQVSVQMAIAAMVIVPISLLVIGRRTQQTLLERRKQREELEAAAANEDEREQKEEPDEELSIEQMASDPNPEKTGPKRGVKGAEGKVLDHSMVEVIVGEIEMPGDPSDSFNVLTDELDDSDIEAEGWQDALSDLEDDDDDGDDENDDGDDDDFKVASKHRTKSGKSEMDGIDTSAVKKKASTKSGGAKKSSKKTPSTKKPKRGKTKSKKPKSTDGGDAESPEEGGPSERGKPPKKKAKKKRPKGKVGHTRGPGVDL
jgi:hypothetical protein